MKATTAMFGLYLLGISFLPAFAQGEPGRAAMTSGTNPEQEIITLSKDKWRWMAERNVEALDKLFAEEAVFVHMGGTMSKSQELNTIRTWPRPSQHLIQSRMSGWRYKRVDCCPLFCKPAGGYSDNLDHTNPIPGRLARLHFRVP